MLLTQPQAVPVPGTLRARPLRSLTLTRFAGLAARVRLGCFLKGELSGNPDFGVVSLAMEVPEECG